MPQSKGIHVLSLEELEYERIASAVRMLKLRKKRTRKEHLLDKMKAQKGMRILKEEGRVKVYRERESRGSDKMTLWRKFSLNNAERKLVLAKRNPEMAKKLELEEEMKRIEAKREREKREEELKLRKEKRLRDGGIWEYDFLCGEYYWDGEGPPILEHNDDQDDPYTEEENRDCLRRAEAALEKAYEDEKRKKREERAELKRAWRQQQKEKLQEPINIEQSDIASAYEKLRDQNMKEREEAMKESGLFDD